MDAPGANCLKSMGKTGSFRKVFYSPAAKAGKSNPAMIDPTPVKVHRTASSMRYDNEPRKSGRSAGGLTTKLHMIANTKKCNLISLLQVAR